MNYTIILEMEKLKGIKNRLYCNNLNIMITVLYLIVIFCLILISSTYKVKYIASN